MTSNQLACLFRRWKRKWRVARGKDIFLAPQIQCATLTFGNPGAAWTFCPERLSETSIVYSFGVGEETSFDRELIHQFRATVHAFDPTPRSIAWLRTQTLPDQFVFHPYGVAAQDGLRRFIPPRNRRHVSHTLLERDSPWDAIEVPVQRLGTIMQTLGHRRIDLLKMDIEGAEYEVLNDLLDSGIAVQQLLIEFHHRWPEVGITRTKNAIDQLNKAGYRIFNVSASGEEYGFLNSSAHLAEDQECRTATAVHDSPRSSEYRPGR
jgi:FkbM family methyltransferase